MEGLEPTRREAPDPKSGMATNYITSANEHCSFLMTANIDTFLFQTKTFFKKNKFSQSLSQPLFISTFLLLLQLNEFISWNYKAP